MKLSDLKNSDYEVVGSPKLTLSSLNPAEIEHVPNPESDEPGALEALGRGAAQGATLGFGDELGGGAYALADAAKKGSLSDIVSDYIKNRDEIRANNEKARSAHPWYYGGGEFAGGLATFPFMGDVTQGIQGAAKLGAAMGLGYSNADLTKGDVGGAIRDTAMGGALGAGAGYIGEKAGNLIKTGAKKVLNTAFDVPEEVTERYLNNHDAINNAFSKEQMAGKLADTLGDVAEETSPLHQQAMETLSSERHAIPEFDINNVADIVGRVKDPKAQELLEQIKNAYLERTSGLAPEPNAQYLTEGEIHGIKKTLQDMADFSSAVPKSEKAIANQASGELNNLLKTNNTDYAQAMSDLSQNIGTKKALASKFGLQRDFTDPTNLTFSDRTMSAMNDIARSNKFDRRAVLDALEAQGHGDLTNDVQNTLDKAVFEGGGRPNGSRKAVLGGAIGAGIGHATGIPGAGYIGGALGASAGASLDKYGPQIGKRILDAGMGLQSGIEERGLAPVIQGQFVPQTERSVIESALPKAAGGSYDDKSSIAKDPQASNPSLDPNRLVQKLSQNPATQKYAQVIQQAASQGGDALAMRHFILQQQDPLYAKAVQNE